MSYERWLTMCGRRQGERFNYPGSYLTVSHQRGDSLWQGSHNIRHKIYNNPLSETSLSIVLKGQIRK